MKIMEKINMNYDALMEYRPITIVAFGDSVTHGSVAEGEFDFETVYWNRLNHPTKEMHELFAQMIFDVLFPVGKQIQNSEAPTCIKKGEVL